jgi:hypothetical protein
MRAILAAIALAGLVGCGPVAPPAPVGAAVAGRAWTYRVTGVERPATLGQRRPVGAWVVILVDLTNTSGRTIGLPAHDLRLYDRAGQRYDAADVLPQWEMAALLGRTPIGVQVPPGVAVRTAVLFDVAPAARGLSLWLEQERRAIELGE